jgi:hypothetical protein
MRALAGRGYWLPQQRITAIKRFAFIGDSYVFGQGVAFDETLPACTERHLNEIPGAAPVEAVNLGVCGYNFWNAWLSFKRAPQVYDGVVLVLCCNDAQLFGRTFNADHAGETTALWLPDSPLHPVLESAFDDIADFARKTGTKLAICYFNVMGDRPYAEQRWSARIAEAIGGRCVARSLRFVDMHAHFVERRFPAETSVVGEADYHPSKAAHDAAARHLASQLREWGWLRDQTGDAATAITSAASALIGSDAYPPDAALRWAQDALAAKLQAARRRQALDGASSGVSTLSKTTEETAHLSALWHAGARTSALLQRALTQDGVAVHLSQLDEQMLRLDELVFAGDASRSALALIPTPAGGERADLGAALPVWFARLDKLTSDLSGVAEKLTTLENDMARSQLAGTDDTAGFLTDARHLVRIARRLRDKIAEFTKTLERVAPHLKSEAFGDVLVRVAADVEAAIRSAALALEKLRPADARAAETLVYVDVKAGRIEEGRHPCALEVQVNATAPQRLPLLLFQNFLPTGEPWKLAFSFPAFYAGRVLVLARMPPAIVGRSVAEIGDIEIVTGTTRRTIKRDALTRDEAGRLVSPPVFVL